MMEQTDLLVHCLCCDATYRESEEAYIGHCPHCDNKDQLKTVYVGEQDNEQ